jgi:hypothetical protein
LFLISHCELSQTIEACLKQSLRALLADPAANATVSFSETINLEFEALFSGFKPQIAMHN